MAANKILILNEIQIEQKINRMSYQILEDCFEEKEIIVAGIADRGYVLAERLQKVIEEISKLKITLVKITLDKNSSHLEATTDYPIEKCKNKAIVVVDDVLNTGRTLGYGLGVFLNIPTRKVRTAVLVDRSHKLFPISTDFVGLTISTVSHEHVSVVLNDKKTDAVYLS